MRFPPHLLVIAVLALGGSGNIAVAQNIIMCGGSASGLSSLIAAGLSAALEKSGTGISLTYQTSSGGLANVVQVTGGKCELGSAAVGEAMLAIRGEQPFSEPVTGFSALMVTQNELPMQWVVSREFADQHDIDSLADLAEKKPPVRVILNRRGILPSATAELSLNAVGITVEDIESWGGKVEFLASGDAADLIQDGRAEMWANATLIGSSAILKIADSMPVKLLQVPDQAVQAVVEKYGDRPVTIPAQSYPWQEADVATHSTTSLIIASDRLDEETAYQIIKAIIENIGQVQAVHPAMKSLTPQVMHSLQNVPYHAGAERAYKEARY
jgi:uncharacterized protein